MKQYPGPRQSMPTAVPDVSARASTGLSRQCMAAQPTRQQAPRFVARGFLSATAMVCLLIVNASPAWAQASQPPRRLPVKDPLGALNDQVRRGERLEELLTGQPARGVPAVSRSAPSRPAVPRFQEAVDLDSFTPSQRQALQRAWNGLPEFARRQAGELVGPRSGSVGSVSSGPRAPGTSPGSSPDLSDSGSNIGGLPPLPSLSSSLPGEVSAPASRRPGIIGHQDIGDVASYQGTHIQLHKVLFVDDQKWAELRETAERRRSLTPLQRVNLLVVTKRIDMVRQLPGGLERVLYHELMHAYHNDNPEQVDEFLAIRHRDLEARIQKEEPEFMARIARASNFESAWGLASLYEEAARVAEKYNLLRRGKDDHVYALSPNEYFAIATALWLYDPKRARAQLSADELSWLDGFFARHDVKKPDQQRAARLGASDIIKRELDQ